MRIRPSFRAAWWKPLEITNINPNTPEGQVLANTHFIAQSAPGIRGKIHKVAMGPQDPMNQLMDLAFGVFNNRDRVREQKGFRDNNERHHYWWHPSSCTTSGLSPL